MDRRHFLRLAASAGMIGALDAFAVACGYDGPTTSPDGGGDVTRYGPLAAAPDHNGILLPEGFSSELLAVGGETVPGTSYRWHPFPDGGACFPVDGGGWVYVNNSEVYLDNAGGAGALRFDAEARVVDAFRVLDGTTMN